MVRYTAEGCLFPRPGLKHCQEARVLTDCILCIEIIKHSWKPSAWRLQVCGLACTTIGMYSMEPAQLLLRCWDRCIHAAGGAAAGCTQLLTCTVDSHKELSCGIQVMLLSVNLQEGHRLGPVPQLICKLLQSVLLVDSGVLEMHGKQADRAAVRRPSSYEQFPDRA